MSMYVYVCVCILLNMSNFASDITNVCDVLYILGQLKFLSFFLKLTITADGLKPDTNSPLQRMARLRPRESAVPEFSVSTTRCFTFFSTVRNEFYVYQMFACVPYCSHGKSTK